MTTVGFVGLGQMGRPMAANLAGAGYEVLAYDRQPDACAALAGTANLRIASDALEVARSCSDVILMLPDSRVVDRLLWEDGFAAALQPQALLVDMGSSDPVHTRENQRRVSAHGVAFVDAPVSGGVKRAIDASLAIMAGGAESDFERARPLLAALGAKIVHVGPPGAGHAVKALNNYVSAAGLLATCEALVAAQRFGIDPSVANGVFNASTGRNNTTENKVEAFMLSGRFDSGFALALMRKDLDTARTLMATLGSAHAFADACSSLWSEAESVLPAGADHTAMFEFARREG